jgi:hypothetical protein
VSTTRAPRSYRPCVGLALFNRQGRVFVGRRAGFGDAAWQMPQGGIDPGESPLDAAIRELREDIFPYWRGKTLEDAREGGCSGCVEVGAFGKEAYILTGYFNLMKMLELALHDGFDVRWLDRAAVQAHPGLTMIGPLVRLVR